MKPVRVAVIDDDDVTRTGAVVLLRSHPQIEVVAELTHDSALTRTNWEGIDVALVDASDHRRVDDQFPGVAVVQNIRRCEEGARVRIIVVTGVMFDGGTPFPSSEAPYVAQPGTYTLRLQGGASDGSCTGTSTLWRGWLTYVLLGTSQ